MANDYVIVTDVACDLPYKFVKEYGLEVASLSFLLNGKEYNGTLDEGEMSVKDIYQALRNGEVITTSAVNSYVAQEAMEKHLKAGKDVYCIMFSSGLSSTCDTTMMVANELKAVYPNQKILVSDSLCASLGEGLIVHLAALEKAKGKSIEEVYQFVEDNKLKVCHWFTVEDLNFLQRGGRISKGAAVIGTALKIKPILKVDNQGKLINVDKVRGRLTSLITLRDKVVEEIVNPKEQTIFISHGDCEEEAQKLADLIKEKLEVKGFVINNVGPVIGAHSGPGTVTVFYLGEKR